MSKIVKGIVEDLKASAKAQHAVDAANFAAVRAEAKANWEEAKASPKARAAMMREEQNKQIDEAKARMEEAHKRIDSARAKRAAVSA